MRKMIIGTMAIGIGVAALIYSFPMMTGSIIAEKSGGSLSSIFSFILIACGLALFFIEAREGIKN